MPRALVSQVQRGRLLDATAEVVAEEGYLATTVHMILKRAGISRRTFYEQFADKEDCFLQTYDEIAGHVLALADDACDYDEPPERQIESGLLAMMRFAKREPSAARVFVVEVMGAGPDARVRRAATMQELTARVAAALQLRYPRREARLRARMVVGGVHEILYDALSRRKTHGLMTIPEAVVSYYLPPVGEPPPGGAIAESRRAGAGHGR